MKTAFESVVRETKVGSKILICNDGLRRHGPIHAAPWLLDSAYVGCVPMTVARFLFEHGKWWAVTEGGGYFSSWILIR